MQLSRIISALDLKCPITTKHMSGDMLGVRERRAKEEICRAGQD